MTMEIMAGEKELNDSVMSILNGGSGAVVLEGETGTTKLEEKPEAGETGNSKLEEKPEAIEETPKLEEKPEATKPEPTSKMTPELQAEIDERIGKVIGKQKELQEKLDGALAELEAAKNSGVAVKLDMHPLLAATSEEAIAKFETDADAFEKWARTNRAGYTQKDSEGNVTQEFTADDIRDRLEDVRAERARLVPQARERLAKRLEADALAKTTYPKLFERGAPEQLEAEKLLSEIPGLRLVPMARVIIGDLLAGRQARMAKARSNPVKPGITIPPKLPAGTKAAGASPLDKKVTKATGLSASAFKAAGGTEEALARQLAAMEI